ncbi:MAG: hypothetical protein ABID63_15855 [Pseudomonadota bacterium]
MGTADRISDLARTLGQFPTDVTITGNNIAIRTSSQLATLNQTINSLENVAAEGDAALAAGYCATATTLSGRLTSAAGQTTGLLTAFAAQDAERLKSLSIMSKQKFDAAASARLEAEKRFASEAQTALQTEATQVGNLPASAPKPNPKPDPTPVPVPPPPTPQSVIPGLPGYLRTTIPADVARYDEDQLAALATQAGKDAITLGTKTGDAVINYATVRFMCGPDVFGKNPAFKWASDILGNTSAGSIDDRLAILRNAATARQTWDALMTEAAPQT